MLEQNEQSGTKVRRIEVTQAQRGTAVAMLLQSAVTFIGLINAAYFIEQLLRGEPFLYRRCSTGKRGKEHLMG